MKRNWQIFWHVLFWVSATSFVAYMAVTNNDKKNVTSADLLIILGVLSAVNIGLFYLNYLYLIPRFLDKKEYRRYALSLVGAIVIFALGKYGLAINCKAYKLLHQDMPFWTYFISSALTNVFFLFLSTALKFGVDWFLNARIQKDLENQRLTAELAFLKSQINPHFLFNSLNSIYSLAYQKSDSAPEAILKLSEIMRYMLYESNDGKVDLAKELQYLQNYIDLQKIRFGNKAFVDFKITGEVSNQKIVPLLLIAFIENAFKHGVASDPAVPIRLMINLSGSNLHFYIENKKHMNNRDIEGGVGLANVERRLELLYPGNYKLDIQDKPDIYTAELSLVL